MTEDNNQNAENKKEDVPPPIPSSGEKEIYNKPDTQSSGNDSSKKDQTAFNLPQPFVIKEHKEQRTWYRKLKPSEIISMIALCISIYAVALNKCSLDNTTKSVAITDSTFKRNIIKDSLAAISNKEKDSINKIKDSITIELAKQSVESQKRYADIFDSVFSTTKYYSARSDSNYIKSINIAAQNLQTIQKNFEIENRAYILLRAAKIDSILPDRHEQVTVAVKNFGKTPALILYTLTGMSIDTIKNPDKLPIPKENIRYSNYYLPPGDEIGFPYESIYIDKVYYALLRSGILHYYVYGTIIYYDIAVGKHFTYTFCIRILENGRFVATPANNRTSEVQSVKAENSLKLKN